MWKTYGGSSFLFCFHFSSSLSSPDISFFLCFCFSLISPVFSPLFFLCFFLFSQIPQFVPPKFSAPLVCSPPLLFISRRRGSPSYSVPSWCRGGVGLPYLCRVRWPPVCRAWYPFLLFIKLVGYVGV